MSRKKVGYKLGGGSTGYEWYLCPTCAEHVLGPWRMKNLEKEKGGTILRERYEKEILEALPEFGLARQELGHLPCNRCGSYMGKPGKWPEHNPRRPDQMIEVSEDDLKRIMGI